MKRRSFLKLGAASAAGVSPRPALAHYQSGVQPQDDYDRAAIVARLRSRFLDRFDAAYVDHVILPHFLVSMYEGERPALPMIDTPLTKENALPADLWGLLSESWKPAPDEGVTVFLQALEKRGPANRRKRIYMSAVTPDLYRPMYREKVAQLLDRLLAPENANTPI
jgi:hypothetical protein